MTLFLLVFCFFVLAVLGMAMGLVLNKRSLQGTCGGLGQIQDLDSACEICEKPCEKRRAAMAKQGYNP